jgi:transcriptional regulator GlxA family with amidase domain
MHRVAVLAREDFVLFELAIPQQIFERGLIDYPGRAGQSGPPYQVRICGERPGPVRSSTGVQVHVEHGAEILHGADTIIVPGTGEPVDRTTELLVTELRAARRRGCRLVSICSGAFLLAAAGILDQRTATTHWSLTGRLARMYPKVKVDDQALYVDERQVLTSAGLAAGIDLCLHIIRTDLGALAARHAAQKIVAEYRSGGQAQLVRSPVPASPENSVSATRQWIMENLAEPLSVAEMAAHARMSVRTFTRHFQDSTGLSPWQWLLRKRVARACELLEATDATVESVAQRCGFSSALSLRQHFVRLLGVTPGQYRQMSAARVAVNAPGLTDPTARRPW